MKLRSIHFLALLPVMVGAAMPFAIANPGHEGVHLAQAVDESIEPGKGWGARRRQKMIEALDLTDEQARQFNAIREEGKASAQENYEVLKAEMEVMRTLVGNSASPDELRSQHQKIQALKQEMGTARFENMLKTYEILTPDQRATFAEKMKMRGGRRGRMGGRRFRRERSGEQLQSFLTF